MRNCTGLHTTKDGEDGIKNDLICYPFQNRSVCYATQLETQFAKIGYYRNLMLSASTQTSIALTKDAYSSKADYCKVGSNSLRKRFIEVVTPSIQSEVCIKSIREIKNRESCHSERAVILPIKEIVSIEKEDGASNGHRKVASRTRKLQEIVLQSQENVKVPSNSLKPSSNHLLNFPETPIHRLLCESQITYRFH